jgi:uncharacterized protein YndB with AHSA1/START domain
LPESAFCLSSGRGTSGSQGGIQASAPARSEPLALADTFEEGDGKTTLTSTTVFDTFEDLEGYLKTGATEGANQTYDRLEELLKTLS